MKKKVLVAIPAYNEAKYIEELLSSLSEYQSDLVVINDGSTDNTYEIVKKMGVNIISHKTNLGLAAAYNSMFNYADKYNYTHMVTLDGDGQHDTSYIPQFIDKLDEYDFITGNRFHSLINIPESKIASNFFALMLSRAAFGITFPDIACGFRGMKLNTETKLIHSLHYGVVYEMLFKKLQSSIKVGVVNIPAKYNTNTPLTTNINEIFGLIGEVVRYNNLYKLKQVSQNLFIGTDFEIELEGYVFKAEYINSSNYKFSTDIIKAKQFYKDNFTLNN